MWLHGPSKQGLPLAMKGRCKILLWFLSHWKYLLNLNCRSGNWFPLSIWVWYINQKSKCLTLDANIYLGKWCQLNSNLSSSLASHTVLSSKLISRDLTSTELLRNISNPGPMPVSWEICVHCPMTLHLWHHFKVCQKDFLTQLSVFVACSKY